MAWLDRAEPLIGKRGIEILQSKRVFIFGLGGVGSFCAEALARSGVGCLVLVDGDSYDETNLNRQLYSSSGNLGEYKVSVISRALSDLCGDIEAFQKYYRPGDFADFLSGQVDYVADCIDDVPAKVDLLKECYFRHIPVISAMGTGNKLDLTQLKVADIHNTSGCPLARSVRQRLRREGVEQGLKVVYSSEQPLTKGNIPASMIFVPGAAGLLMAQEIVKDLLVVSGEEN